MRLATITVVLLTTVCLSQISADDASKPSTERQVLERFIGTWDSVVTNIATGEKAKTVERRKWSRKGKFVLSENFDRSTKREAYFLMTYDPNGGVYRSCYIDEVSAAVVLFGT